MAERARALGLPSATALVIGSIIGTGVFTMPAVMAGAGTSSLITLGIVAAGALLLGVLFGQLTKHTALAFRFPWELLFLSAGAIAFICVLAAFISIRKVFQLEPAIVFKG